jgi:hypothetical protein
MAMEMCETLTLTYTAENLTLTYTWSGRGQSGRLSKTLPTQT